MLDYLGSANLLCWYIPLLQLASQLPLHCPLIGDHCTLQIPEYIQIVGIICGMITIGYLGDKIGRKWGSVCTVSLMCVGAILLTVQNAPTDRGQVIFCESIHLTTLLQTLLPSGCI